MKKAIMILALLSASYVEASANYVEGRGHFNGRQIRYRDGNVGPDYVSACRDAKSDARRKVPYGCWVTKVLPRGDKCTQSIGGGVVAYAYYRCPRQ
jgi:hypothetical protein